MVTDDDFDYDSEYEFSQWLRSIDLVDED